MNNPPAAHRLKRNKHFLLLSFYSPAKSAGLTPEEQETVSVHSKNGSSHHYLLVSGILSCLQLSTLDVCVLKPGHKVFLEVVFSCTGLFCDKRKLSVLFLLGNESTLGRTDGVMFF